MCGTRLDVLQESGEIKTRVAALKASEAEQLAKIDPLESHEPELPNDNRRLEHQLVTTMVEKENH